MKIHKTVFKEKNEAPTLHFHFVNVSATWTKPPDVRLVMQFVSSANIVDLSISLYKTTRHRKEDGQLDRAWLLAI